VSLVTRSLAFGLAVSGNARAEPVVYNLYAVTDGKLGSQTISRAQVTITFRGGTRNVVRETVPDAVVYRIDQGDATVTLNRGGSKTVAHVADGQIYVRYDTTNGVVGFGSFATGTTYPITLICDPLSNEDCTMVRQRPYTGLPFNQLMSALANIKATGDASSYSAGVNALPTNLTDSTLLTGVVSACAVAYTSSNSTNTCPLPPATPIHTDLGDFYLEDQVFGSDGIFTVVVGKEANAEEK
jgi:hypothetical protein